MGWAKFKVIGKVMVLKEIQLNRGMTTMVDDEFYDSLSKHRWHVEKFGNNFYASRNCPEKRRVIKMHREILGAQSGAIVDHIDGNGLNNQLSNLRICTHSENMRNRLKDSGSLAKGVSMSKSKKNPYFARIMVDGKQKSLGSFPTVQEAADAYDRAAVFYYGDFARTNRMHK